MFFTQTGHGQLQWTWSIVSWICMKLASFPAVIVNTGLERRRRWRTNIGPLYYWTVPLWHTDTQTLEHSITEQSHCDTQIHRHWTTLLLNSPTVTHRYTDIGTLYYGTVPLWHADTQTLEHSNTEQSHCDTQTHRHWNTLLLLSLIHIWRCRRSTLCRSRWSPYH